MSTKQAAVLPSSVAYAIFMRLVWAIYRQHLASAGYGVTASRAMVHTCHNARGKTTAVTVAPQLLNTDALS